MARDDTGTNRQPTKPGKPNDPNGPQSPIPGSNEPQPNINLLSPEEQAERRAQAAAKFNSQYGFEHDENGSWLFGSARGPGMQGWSLATEIKWHREHPGEEMPDVAPAGYNILDAPVAPTEGPAPAASPLLGWTGPAFDTSPQNALLGVTNNLAASWARHMADGNLDGANLAHEMLMKHAEFSNTYNELTAAAPEPVRRLQVAPFAPEEL